MEVAAYSHVGSKYGSLNQDDVLTTEVRLPNGNVVLVVLVLDGHGMLGEVAAKAAGMAISEHIEGQLRKLRPKSLRDLGSRKIKDVINAAFQKAHDTVIGLYVHAPQEYSFPAPGGMIHGEERPQSVFSLGSLEGGVLVYSSPTTGFRLVEFGTTASLALIEPGYVVVGHVGDSDVVVGSVDNHGFVTASGLTKPHTAFSASERFRIAELLTSGDNDDSFDLVNFRDDGYLEVPQLGGLPNSVALGMTRAIGHKWLEEFGVSPRPDIKCYDTEDQDVVLILASDGVWDAMHPRDCSLYVIQRLLAEGTCIQQVAEELCNVCVLMQNKALGASDNTSAVVVRLATQTQEAEDRGKSVRSGKVFLSLNGEDGRGKHHHYGGCGI